MFFRSRHRMVWHALTGALSFRPFNTRRAYLSVSHQFCNHMGESFEFSPSEAARTLTCNKVAAWEVMRGATAKQVAAFLKCLQERKVSPATLEHRLKTLCSVFGILKRAGLILDNPADQPWLILKDRSQVRPNTSIPTESVRRLLEAPPDDTCEGVRDRAMLALFFACGARRSELAGLLVGDIEDGEYLRVIFRSTKTRKDKETLVNGHASNALAILVDQRAKEGAGPDSRLFISYHRKRSQSLSGQHINRIFQHWCRAVGIKRRVSSHCGRHTTVTKLLSEGIPLKAVSEYVGHSSVTSTMRYQTLVDRDSNPIPRTHKY